MSIEEFKPSSSSKGLMGVIYRKEKCVAFSLTMFISYRELITLGRGVVPFVRREGRFVGGLQSSPSSLTGLAAVGAAVFLGVDQRLFQHFVKQTLILTAPSDPVSELLKCFI